METLYSVLDWIGGLLAAGALALIAFSHKELRIARAILMAAVVLTTARWEMWSFTTNASWPVRTAVGAIIGAFLLGAVPAFWQWAKEREIVVGPPPSQAPPSHQKLDDAPPLGSLRMGQAQLIIEHKRSTDEIAAQIRVEIFNDTGKLIFFHAVTAGNINGIPFDKDKVQFDGYVYPGKSTFLMSRRIAPIEPLMQKSVSEPSIVGIYDYELHYRYADETDFSRATARGIRINQWMPVGDMYKGLDPGQSREMRAGEMVIYYNDEK